MIYQNLSCNYAHLDSFDIEGLNAAKFTTNLTYHLACQGLADTLLILISPLTPGVRNISVTERFINDEYQRIDTGFSVTMIVSPEPIAKIYMKHTSITSFAGDTIEIPVYLNSMQTITGLHSVDLTYALNPVLLTPISFKATKGITADPLKITKTTATVTLHFDSSFTFSAETELGRLRCAAYVTDTLETDINLIGAAHSSGCLAVLVDGNAVHFTPSQCGATTLSRFMNGILPINITSIRPNPAQDEIEISLRSALSQNVTIEIFDALGVKVLSSAKNMTNRTNIISLNTKGLASGIYFVRVGDVSQSLVISR